MSQNPVDLPTRKQVWYHAKYGIAQTSIMLIRKRVKMKSTSVQQAWTEKILLAFRTKIFIFSGFKEQLALAVHVITDR